MEEPRVRELMALADAMAKAAYGAGRFPCATNDAVVEHHRARLESALRQEPVDSHARQTFRPKELPMNPMQEAMRPFSDLSGGEQEPQGGVSEEETGVMRFARFGAELFKRHRNDGYPGDVDGGELQELAEKFGLIEQREVTEPCGDGCTCAEIGDFPSVCYFTTAEAKKARAILAAAGGRK